MKQLIKGVLSLLVLLMLGLAVFAAGDVRDKSTKQVSSAAGEGTTAALIVREYLKLV